MKTDVCPASGGTWLPFHVGLRRIPPDRVVECWECAKHVKLLQKGRVPRHGRLFWEFSLEVRDVQRRHRDTDIHGRP